MCNNSHGFFNGIYYTLIENTGDKKQWKLNDIFVGDKTSYLIITLDIVTKLNNV